MGVELSSIASGSGSLQHKGGGMVAELLVLRILLGTIPSLDNRTGQKTENAGKKNRNVFDGLRRPFDDRGRPQSTSVRRHPFVLEVGSCFACELLAFDII